MNCQHLSTTFNWFNYWPYKFCRFQSGPPDRSFRRNFLLRICGRLQRHLVLPVGLVDRIEYPCLWWLVNGFWNGFWCCVFYGNLALGEWVGYCSVWSLLDFSHILGLGLVSLVRVQLIKEAKVLKNWDMLWPRCVGLCAVFASMARLHGRFVP